jgi:hypothetical protein
VTVVNSDVNAIKKIISYIGNEEYNCHEKVLMKTGVIFSDYPYDYFFKIEEIALKDIIH